MHKPKLLFLVDKMENGGAERQLVKIASLYAHKYDVEITSLLPAEQNMLEQASELTYTPLATTPSKGTLGKLKQLYRSYQGLKQLAEKNQYEAVFSFLEWSNVLTIKAFKNSPLNSTARIYLNVRNYLSNQYSNKLKQAVAKTLLPRFYNQASGVLCNSNAIKQDLETNFKIKSSLIKVIYNSVAVEKITRNAKSVEPPFNKQSNALTFVSCGRLADQKQFNSLLLSFHQYNTQNNRNDKLYIVGSGPLKSTLQNTIDTLSINAELVGHQNNAPAWLFNADCFILNSFFEGFPNVLAESVVLGTYAITADCLSGPREIMTNFAISDYNVALDDVYPTDFGVLYKVEQNDSAVNKHLVEALTMSLARINTHKAKPNNSDLLNDNFGITPWYDILG